MLGPGEHQLRRSRLGADQEIRVESEIETPGDGPGDQLGLVVTALTAAVPVQGNRNDDVGAPLRCRVLRDCGQLRAKPIRERGDLFVLQQEHGFGKGAVVNGKAAGAIERVELSAAKAAAQLDRLRKQ